MTNSVLLIATAAAALLIANKKAASDREKKDELDAELELLKASIEASENRNTASDLAISIRVSISSIGDTLWNCKVVWMISNLGTQPYYVSDIRSTFSIAGYKVNEWIPGNKSEVLIPAGREVGAHEVIKTIPFTPISGDGAVPFVPMITPPFLPPQPSTPGSMETYIAPGDTVEIESSINDKKLWSNSETIKIVREKIKKALGVDLLSKVNFPVSSSVLSKLIVCDSTSFKLSTPYADSTNTINITNEIPSSLDYPAYARVFAKRGSNALDWDNE